MNPGHAIEQYPVKTILRMLLLMMYPKKPNFMLHIQSETKCGLYVSLAHLPLSVDQPLM